MTDKEKVKIKLLFDKYDENKNGVLEKSEFLKGFKELINNVNSFKLLLYLIFFLINFFGDWGLGFGDWVLWIVLNPQCLNLLR